MPFIRRSRIGRVRNASSIQVQMLRRFRRDADFPLSIKPEQCGGSDFGIS
jgi:hypothetical protein